MRTLASVLLVLVALTAVAQQAVERTPFVGAWHGKAHDLPAVTLVVQQEEGRLTGTIVFYRLKRDTEQQPWRVKGGAIQPLIDPRADGRRLTFAVYNASHEGEPEGPNVPMTVELTGPGRARLGDLELIREP